MPSIKFSIIIPLYNKAAYIISTLDSVMAQTFTDFEVIVVDDGSSDGGDQLVAALTHPRLRVVRQANAGVSVARNQGITMARGEWVVFLDADDWHHPNFLATLLSAQKTYPEADTVATAFVSVPDIADQWPPLWAFSETPATFEIITDLPRRWMLGPTFFTSSVAVKTSRLKKMQPCFAPGESYGEDLDLWFRLAEQAPVALAHVPMAAYRVEVMGSLTMTYTTLELPPFFQRMRARALSGAMTAAQRSSALWFIAQQEVTLGRDALVLGKRLQSLRCLVRGRHAASGRRWWLTAAMTLLLPGSLVKIWQRWRIRRMSPVVEARQTMQARTPDDTGDRPELAPVCRVSVIIKTLNEEQRISATLESALNAVARVGGEVVLADSCSSDRTVELAQPYPIRIVQLRHAHERCCGVGPQLGYQHSRGEFVYILDGDMHLLEGFLEQALDFMVAHPEVAGVGGRVVEQNQESLEYLARAERITSHHLPGCVDRLDCGGLYRRSAIEAAGYLSDRNLHSYEEFDLAVRLRALGWKLWRLPTDAVHHFGHDMPPYHLLVRRWHTRYICGLGELVRAAAGEPRLRLVLAEVRELRLYMAVLAWWALLASVPFWPLEVIGRLAIFCTLVTAPVALMAWRKRSAAKAMYSVVSWSVNAAGLLRGLLRTQRPAREAILSWVLKEPTSLAPQSTQSAGQ